MTSVQNFSPERGAQDGKEPEAGQGCTMDTLKEIAALATDAPFPMVIFGNTDRAVALCAPDGAGRAGGMSAHGRSGSYGQPDAPVRAGGDHLRGHAVFITGQHGRNAF